MFSSTEFKSLPDLIYSLNHKIWNKIEIRDCHDQKMILAVQVANKNMQMVCGRHLAGAGLNTLTLCLSAVYVCGSWSI
jgi:hypothetical protein